jgi:hypothetical protein
VCRHSHSSQRFSRRCLRRRSPTRFARSAATWSRRRTFCSRLRRHALRVLWVLGEPPLREPIQVVRR